MFFFYLILIINLIYFKKSMFFSIIISVFISSVTFSWFICERNFQPSFIIFIKPIILQSIHCYCTLQRVLKINKTEIKLSTTLSNFFYKSHIIKTWKRSEYVYYLKNYELLLFRMNQ